MVQITRADAVALCVALGYKAASKWNKQRMLDKLKELSQMAREAGFRVPKDEDDAERLNKLLRKIVDEKGEVEISQKVQEGETPVVEETAVEEVVEKKAKKAKKAQPVEEEEEAAEEAVEEKPKKAKKVKKEEAEPVTEEGDEIVPAKAKPVKKAKSGKVERDRFTNRIGSQAAEINAVLDKKGKSYEKICEETKFGAARVRAHIKFLVEKGFVSVQDNKVLVN